MSKILVIEDYDLDETLYNICKKTPKEFERELKDVIGFEAIVTVFTPDSQVLHLWLDPAQKLNLKKDGGVDVFLVKKAEVK